MHTILVVSGGFLLLGLCLLIGLWTGLGLAKAALIFIPIWLVVAVINMGGGVSKAGYSIAEETPIFLIIFDIPVIVSAVIWWKLSHI